jgi:NADP+-dependent farnesol dehydrogenase
LRENLSPAEQKNFHAMKCDISVEEEVIKGFSEIEKKFGGVDVLINNAGIVATSSIIDPKSSDDNKNVINTNVFGVLNCTREAVNTIRKRGVDGHIIHINSIAGHFMPYKKDFPSFGIYAASKHAVTALAEQHRQEFMREKLNIKVTVRNKFQFFFKQQSYSS